MFDAIDLELVGSAALFSVAVSADAALLTVCEFEANARRWRALRWIVCVTLAHALLAGLGLSGFWTLRAGAEGLACAVQVLTAVILVLLIGQAAHELWSNGWRGRGAPSPEGGVGFAAKVWLVSVDALFVGTAQSAAAPRWSALDVAWFSALLTPGILVSLAAALAVSRALQRRVSDRRLEPGRIERGAGLGQHGVALPVLSYFLLCVLRGGPLI